ncbi:hypothetical protein L1887_61080 [Cichorium endivia]|nr:hypothetical protein L1887_61080 [Cichorium endivia]
MFARKSAVLQVKKAGCGRWYKTEQRVRRAADLFCIGDECVSGQKVLQRDHPLFRDVRGWAGNAKYDRASALGQAGLTTGGLREHLGARAADNDGLGVREDGGDGEAAGALDVHEERVGVLHKSLELVAASLLLGRGVEEVNGESLSEMRAIAMVSVNFVGETRGVAHRSRMRVVARMAQRWQTQWTAVAACDRLSVRREWMTDFWCEAAIEEGVFRVAKLSNIEPVAWLVV